MAFIFMIVLILIIFDLPIEISLIVVRIGAKRRAINLKKYFKLRWKSFGIWSVTTVLRTYKGRTYKGQFTFFKKIYCARIRDKFLQKIIFNQKIWSTFFFLGGLKFSIAQKKSAKSAILGKCQIGNIESAL